MLNEIIVKIVSVIISVLMGLGIPVTPPQDVECSADATVEFYNETAGSAAGTISVTANIDGNYQLYWGDDENQKLTFTSADCTASYTEFADVNVKKGSGKTELNQFLAIPEGAENILIYKNDVFAGSEEIPDNKQSEKEKAVYCYGALSDIHFNRYNKSGDDDALIAFPNALDFFKSAGTSMVAISGDLSKNGERNAYEKFNKIVSEYDFPVFSCKGNHDCRKKFKLEDWQEFVNTGVYSEKKRDGVLNVSDNGLDFVYSGKECHGDIFIFFSQTDNQYILPTSRLVTDEQLDWLQEQLETYKDKRVYLYFHTFLTAPGCNPLKGEGNVQNNLGIGYPLPYVTGTKDEKRFRNLLKEYKNIVFFNGHSHWSYDMQNGNDLLNITDYDGEYAPMVHISSVTSPRSFSNIDFLWHSNSNEMSEGYLVTVYENKIVLNAIDFINGNVLAYATYTISK